MNTTPSSIPRISSTTTSDGIAVTRTPRHGNWPMVDQQVDATRQAGNSNKRALVLAGDGAAGNAWELGLANDAVLTEGRRVLIEDPHQFDGVRAMGVDEHCWRHTRRAISTSP